MHLLDTHASYVWFIRSDDNWKYDTNIHSHKDTHTIYTQSNNAVPEWPFPFRITIVRNHILPAFHNYCAEEVKRDFTEFLMLGHKFWCFRWIVLALYIVKMCKSKKKTNCQKKIYIAARGEWRWSSPHSALKKKKYCNNYIDECKY